MAAVRAALPSFGIGLLAGGAEDAFRERHREIGAHCTLRTVDESRRRTLLALIDLAEENSPERVLGRPRGRWSCCAAGDRRGAARAGGGRGADRARLRGGACPAKYTVRVEARFESAHYLREYRGISEPLHGHSYKVEADLAARGGGVDRRRDRRRFRERQAQARSCSRRSSTTAASTTSRRSRRSIPARRTSPSGSPASCRPPSTDEDAVVVGGDDLGRAGELGDLLPRVPTSS